MIKGSIYTIMFVDKYNKSLRPLYLLGSGALSAVDCLSSFFRQLFVDSNLSSSVERLSSIHRIRKSITERRENLLEIDPKFRFAAQSFRDRLHSMDDCSVLLAERGCDFLQPL